MAEYKSPNAGLLKIEDVKTGDKIIIVDEAYSKFVKERQTTYWNAKVMLPNGQVKLAGLFESACDKFASAWGTDTAKWVGHTVNIEIKPSKAGKNYISMTPSDEIAVDVDALQAEIQARNTAHTETPNKPVPPMAPASPTETVAVPVANTGETPNPDDIPF